MCTCNGERFLAEQLGSIVAQSRPPDELVVCDDASTDGTWTLLTTFASRAPFPVTLRRNDVRLGVVGNFSQAMTLATGDAIALADQDDVWLPGKLKKLEDALLANPAAGFVFSDADLIDEHGLRLGSTLWPVLGVSQERQTDLKAGRAVDLLMAGSTVTGATMMFRAVYRSAVLPIPADLWILHDGWAALVMSALAPVALVSEPLMQYRQHAMQEIGLAGASAGASVTDASIAAGLARRNPYDRVISVLVRVLDRLEAIRDLPGRQRGMRYLRAGLTHMRARAALPPRSARRVALVVRELASGRYHRFGRGVLSAAKDAFS